MRDEASYQCDSCGEEIVVRIDLTGGSRQEYVEDCPVCCCPNLIHVEIEAMRHHARRPGLTVHPFT